MHSAAGIVVVAFGLYLIGLAATIVFRPQAARRFLGAFAGSARAHYIEQAARLVVGTALVIFAPSMRHPELFGAFGWIVLATTLGLLLIPWRWHNRFAQWAVPFALRQMKLFAVGAFALGNFVLYAVA